jgi:hypothetical protein
MKEDQKIWQPKMAGWQENYKFSTEVLILTHIQMLHEISICFIFEEEYLLGYDAV